MSEIFDIYNLIFLVIAVAILLRLRSVLGRRTGNERPPFDPVAQNREAPAPVAVDAAEPPPVDPDEAERSAVDKARRIAKVAPEGSTLNEGLSAIAAVDPSFDPEGFLKGARVAYEMIVGAFAAGDRKTLKPLLSREVFDGFAAAISDRESRGEKVESTFVGIERIEIQNAGLKGTAAWLTLRVQCQFITVTRDRAGAIIDGDPNRIGEVVDIWTFSRDTTSRDPNWKLVATEAAS